MQSDSCTLSTNQKTVTTVGVKSLAYAKGNFNIILYSPYHPQAFSGKKKRPPGEILRKLSQWKTGTVLEARCCPDHIHMLRELPRKMSISRFYGSLKGMRSLMMYERLGDMKLRFSIREFWCRGSRINAVRKIQRKFRNTSEDRSDG